MTSPRDEIRKRIRTKAGFETNSSTISLFDRMPNKPLNLTKSPLRCSTVERFLTGAFAG